MNDIIRFLMKFLKWMFLFSVVFFILMKGSADETLESSDWPVEKKIEVWRLQDDLGDEIGNLDSSLITDTFGVKELTPLLPKVGDSKEAAFVKHSSTDGYSIALASDSGELSWIPLGFEDEGLTVKLDDSIPNSRLIRNENFIETTEYPLTSSVEITDINYRYTLFIRSDDLDGDSYQQNCGKNCFEEVNETVF